MRRKRKGAKEQEGNGIKISQGGGRKRDVNRLYYHTHTRVIITIVVDITLTLIRRHRVCIKRSNIHKYQRYTTITVTSPSAHTTYTGLQLIQVLWIIISNRVSVHCKGKTGVNYSVDNGRWLCIFDVPSTPTSKPLFCSASSISLKA